MKDKIEDIDKLIIAWLKSGDENCTNLSAKINELFECEKIIVLQKFLMWYENPSISSIEATNEVVNKFIALNGC